MIINMYVKKKPVFPNKKPLKTINGKVGIGVKKKIKLKINSKTKNNKKF